MCIALQAKVQKKKGASFYTRPQKEKSTTQQNAIALVVLIIYQLKTNSNCVILKIRKRLWHYSRQNMKNLEIRL